MFYNVYNNRVIVFYIVFYDVFCFFDVVSFIFMIEVDVVISFYIIY